MKKTVLRLSILPAILMFSLFFGSRVFAADTIIVSSFPDSVFQNYVRENFDTNGDWILSDDEKNAVTDMFMA